MAHDKTDVKLPIELKLTEHRHGGRIVKVHEIRHETAEPQDGCSRDHWYFVCDIEWDDGTASKIAEVAPALLVRSDVDPDASLEEINGLLSLMNEYLRLHGEWFFNEDSGHQGWYAHR